MLSVRTALAPMAGVTDRPFRVLARRLGAGLATAEMLTSDVRLWHTTKSRRRMDHEGEPEPRIVQLAGADPEAMAEAARRNVGLGAQVIDINLGCPAKKVCNRHCGSALLADEPLVARLLDAVVRAVAVPVSVKMRTGVDREHRNAVAIAQLAAQAGVSSLAVHGRTRADQYAGNAEYDTIRAIKAEVALPIYANGDICSGTEAAHVLAHTRADGVMIGRAAHGAPWIFRDVNHFLANGRPPPRLSRAEVRAIILGHLTDLYAFYGETDGLRFARKHLGWYLERLHGSAIDRRMLMAAATSSLQFASMAQWLDLWVDGSAVAA